MGEAGLEACAGFLVRGPGACPLVELGLGSLWTGPGLEAGCGLRDPSLLWTCWWLALGTITNKLEQVCHNRNSRIYFLSTFQIYSMVLLTIVTNAVSYIPRG